VQKIAPRGAFFAVADGPILQIIVERRVDATITPVTVATPSVFAWYMYLREPIYTTRSGS
jgi:hypothetical protein